MGNSPYAILRHDESLAAVRDDDNLPSNFGTDGSFRRWSSIIKNCSNSCDGVSAQLGDRENRGDEREALKAWTVETTPCYYSQWLRPFALLFIFFAWRRASKL
jgi:hypothetical protein